MPPKRSTKADRLGGEDKLINGYLSHRQKFSVPSDVPVLSLLVPPSPEKPLEQKLSFSQCLSTDKERVFPRYLAESGLMDMIMYALVRLEREKERPPDPWEWLRWRIFMDENGNPGDKEYLKEKLAELRAHRNGLLSERNDIINCNQTS